MSFLTPAAFVLAALLPVIIAMYLLKLRRTEQLVSSVYLWRRAVRDIEANAPWQRLRRNLLLILQLLFLAALILALARPFTWTEGASGQALILILDTSASMAATDVAPSRLEAARAQARQLVDGLPADARVTVIAAGDGALVLLASSRDRRQAHQTIDSLRAGSGGSDLAAALELASAVAARQSDAEIVILSDGRATLPERLAVEGRLRYLPQGISGDNQAIGTLSLELTPGGERLTAFAQVINYGDAAAQRRLTLYADGQLVDAYDLDIPPGGQRAVVADDLPAGAEIVEARLAGSDALSLDDRAWAVQRSASRAAVTLVSEGNLFLETALSLLPGLETTVVKPADFHQSQSTSLPTTQPLAHLTILDTFVPLTATLPVGNLFFIGPPRSTGYFSVTGAVDQPAPWPTSADDPLLAHVDLTGVSVLEAVRVPLPGWARTVVAGDPSPGSGQSPGESVPLLFAGETDGRRVAVLAFDLHRSDLPLQVAFPILMSNLIGWLAPGSGAEVPLQVAPGAAVSLSLPPEVEAVAVRRPDGSTARLEPEDRRVTFADTAQLGVYQFTWGEDARASLAVNLFAPAESDIRPAGSLPLVGAGEGGEAAPQQARREWWPSLAWLALALLTVEWLVYHRASLTRLWGRVKGETSNVEGGHV
ncbi:MAG: vWA domain-containing protein [Chloroflexota bacterium]